MTINDIILRIMRDEHVTQVQMAERLGYSGQSSFRGVATRAGITYNSAARILDALGYEVVVQKKHRAGAASIPSSGAAPSDHPAAPSTLPSGGGANVAKALETTTACLSALADVLSALNAGAAPAASPAPDTTFVADIPTDKED